MVQEEGFERGREVLKQMEAIGHLDRFWCAPSCSLGIPATSVPTDDLWAPVLLQPGHQGFRLTVRQEIDDAVPLEVDHDRAITVTTTEGEVVDAQNARRVVVGHW